MEERSGQEKWHRGATDPQNAAAQPALRRMEDQDQVSKDRAGMEKWHRRATE